MELIGVDIHVQNFTVEVNRIVRLALPDARTLDTGVRFDAVRKITGYISDYARKQGARPTLLGVQLFLTSNSSRFRRVMIKEGRIDLDRIRSVHAELVEVIANTERQRAADRLHNERGEAGLRRLYAEGHAFIREHLGPSEWQRLTYLLDIQRKYPFWTIEAVEASLARMEEADAQEQTEAGPESST